LDYLSGQSGPQGVAKWPANFLKHADRHPNALLAASDIKSRETGASSGGRNRAEQPPIPIHPLGAPWPPCSIQGKMLVAISESRRPRRNSVRFTRMLPSTAKYLGNVHANAADQFLISYLILTRFPESSPYALGFALAHCLEVSTKAAIYQTKGEPPPTGQKGHVLLELIKVLPDDSKLKDELKNSLPKKSALDEFLKNVNEMNENPPIQMLRKFFALNPNFDTDEWMVLYAMFRVVDLKYGVDTQKRVLQLMQPVNPKLNKLALRLIASARQYFPCKESHRTTIADFIDKVPEKYDIGAEVKRLAPIIRESRRLAM
jgi:hypothetical protein